MSDKEKMEFVNDFVKKLEADNLTRKEMLSNAKYIEWLIDFSEKYPNFNDDTWLYFPEKISAKDNEQVDKLSRLYECIDQYAQNYIDPIECDFGQYYRVKYKGVGFEIAMLSGQGTVFCFSRVDIDDNNFIDFEDVMLNTKIGGLKISKKDYDMLYSLVLNLTKKGLPENIIREAVDNVFRIINK